MGPTDGKLVQSRIPDSLGCAKFFGVNFGDFRDISSGDILPPALTIFQTFLLRGLQVALGQSNRRIIILSLNLNQWQRTWIDSSLIRALLFTAALAGHPFVATLNCWSLGLGKGARGRHKVHGASKRRCGSSPRKYE
jgi:hypothetical protein